mmetsp:Transcript_14554/g.31695  ORF Transcript_14554/g.31695 Transcript_14554/m.31695 type:complete len:435 (+) Transcript_14554:51-1355(+)
MSTKVATGLVRVLCYTIVLVHLSVAQPLEQGSQFTPADELLSCFKGNLCLETRQTTWDHLLQNKPSCLVGAKVWWSKAPSALPITIITQLSVNRLQQLKAQCATWLGPIAAVIYVPIKGTESESIPETLAVAGRNIDEVFFNAEKEKNCQLRLLLMYEEFTQPRAAALLYPVNALRNYARLMADTPLIANIDVDMIPSLSLSRSLSQQTGESSHAASMGAETYITGCTKHNRVYVIPAFETTCGGPSAADRAVQLEKQKLTGLMDEQCLMQFRGNVAPACHNVTDYQRWFRAESAYQVQYATEYEPWFISDRSNTLWYDERYRGYGKNKIVQVAATAAAGSEFHVHPHGFIVHRYHTESDSRKAFLRVKFKSRQNAQLLKNSLYAHIEQLWAESKVEIAQGKYLPMISDDVTACMAKLSWWKGLNPPRRRGEGS